MPVERTEPPATASEPELLEDLLDYHRATLERKCEGLSDEQLRERPVTPSSLSLLGLLRHMVEVERHWFRNIFNGEDSPSVYFTEERLNDDFDDLEGAPVSVVMADWRAQCERAREIVRGASVDDISKGVHPRRGERFSLRWIMTHMIAEYARHNGHADLIRERLDGTTGE